MSDLNVKQPLKWFWIFYRFDKINEKVTEKEGFTQKSKFIFVIIIQILMISQSLYLYLARDGNSFKKILLQFDVIKYCGSGHKPLYLCYLSATALEMCLLLLLNNSNTFHYKWFEIIEVLNECKHFHRIGLNDYKFIEKYIKSVKFVKSLTEKSFNLFSSCCILLALYLILENFNLETTFISYVTLIWYTLYFRLSLPIMYYSFFYYYIVCKNIKIRLTLITENIAENTENSFQEFHKICYDLDSYNKFWRNYLKIIFYFMTPFSLIGIFMVFSNGLMAIIKILSVVYLIFTLGVGLLFNLFTASVNHEINKIFKNLNTFYIKNESILRTISKLKLLTAIERCGHKTCLIGFSCGQQFVITRQIAFKTIIIFFRFVLLTQKLKIQ